MNPSQHIFARMVGLLMLAVLLPSSTILAQQTAPLDVKTLRRKIFIPLKDLDVLLLEGNSNRVLLTNDEYRQLVADAEKNTISRAPADGSILSANYRATIADGIASIKGELKLKFLNTGLIELPLQLKGVTVRQAELDGQPAALHRTEKGSIHLLVLRDPESETNTEDETSTLKLDLLVPLRTTAARQMLSFQLPANSATRLAMSVPGNVEVKSGVSVIERQYDESKNSTSFDLLLERKEMDIVMSLNNKQLKDEQVIVARDLTIHELSGHDQLMHTTCSVDVINGAVEQFRFQIPTGYQIESVEAKLLSQWSVAATDAGRELIVDLREATREDFVVGIKAARKQRTDGQWSASKLMPIDVAGQVSVVGIVADTTLLANNVKSSAAIPIDHQFLLAAIPPTMDSTERLKIVGAFYSPQSDYQIDAEFTTPKPELVVDSNARILITNQRLVLEGGVQVISRYDTKVDLGLILPAGWRLTSIANQTNQPLPFTEDSSRPERVTIQLPKKLSEQPTQLYFNAESVPDNWLDPWQENQFNFAGIQIEGQTEHRGSIAVATREDISITPLNRTNLELLEEANQAQYKLGETTGLLAYEFAAANYQLTVRAKRIAPQMLARSMNFYSISPQAIGCQHELVFEVKQAKQDTFLFDLPLTAPTSVNITSCNVRLKDSTSEAQDGSRRWTVQLSEPTLGKVHLIVQYEIPRNDATAAQELTPAIAQDVQLQNTFVVVEGSNELDTTIVNPGRGIDIGELADASYQLSRQVLGAFAWKELETPVKLTMARREFFPLAGAIVQDAEFVSAVSTDGKLQTAAKYSLKTKQLPFLEIELPDNSTLWSVRLDGKPAKPQRQDDRMLVSLVGATAGQLRELQLVYESSIDSIGLSGKLKTQTPQLRINRSTSNIADWEDVPVVNHNWRIILPKGYAVTGSNLPLQSRPTVLETLGHWLSRLGGGIQTMVVREAAQVSADYEVREQYKVDPKGIEYELEDDRSKRPSAVTRETEGAMLEELPEPQSPKPRPSKADVQSWALQGLRSLNIELTESENTVEFSSLSGNQLQAELVNRSRISWLAGGLLAILLGIAVIATGRSAVTKFVWVIGLIVTAQVLAIATNSAAIFNSLIDVLIIAAILSAIYFLIASTLIRIGGFIWSNLIQSGRWITAAILLPLACLPASALAAPQQSQNNLPANAVVQDLGELQKLLQKMGPTQQLQLPDDAILVPYDPSEPRGRESANQVLIPYRQYLALKQQRVMGEAKPELGIEYVLSSSSYSVELADSKDDYLKGEVVIEVLTDDPVAIPLRLTGGALADAKVDGQPAKLKMIDPPATKKRNANQSNVMLYLEGKGTRRLTFGFRVKPIQQGGWRIVTCHLPVGLSRSVEYLPPATPIELLVSSDADRRVIESKDATPIQSVVSADGRLRFQWKPTSADQVIDQALTVASDAVFDIREDGLRLTWNMTFEFRGGERDSFSVEIPDGFLVEQVIGENVRSWNVIDRKADKQPRRLDIELLGSAKLSESFTIDLSRRDFPITEKAVDIKTPSIVVPSASLHQGTVSIRHSPIIELKTGITSSAARIESATVQRRVNLQRIDAQKSPLGIQAFQDFQFQRTPFEINLNAAVAPESYSAKTASLLRIGQSKLDIETRFSVDVKKRPLYQLQLWVPEDLNIEQLAAGRNETWIEKVIGQRKLITIQFPNGISETLDVLLTGTLSSFESVPEDFTQSLDWALPSLEVVDADPQQVEFVVQADPAINVTARELEGLETPSIRQFNWLQASQATLARVALRSKTKRSVQADAWYSGKLRLNRIRPRVEVAVITNVRTTRLAVEQTMLLDFNIQAAGIRELTFQLPDELKDARINAQLLSEKIVEPVEGSDAVNVTLKLQDDVMGDYRIVVEHDRELPSGELTIRLPRSLTGKSSSQFITLQNAGRDEIEIAKLNGMQRLNRQQRDYAVLKQKLADAEVTLAYVSNPGNPSPSLDIRLKTRDSLETVAASIGFSKTTMVVDHDGAFRSQQVFQVNNRSEQYLDVALPNSARLLTAFVDGEPVKPVRWNQGDDPTRVRIPLLKTEEGDLDYPVVIKYAGQLERMSSFANTEFPVAQTLNINVQLSQLHLRLPATHRWLNFAGTMTQVDEKGDLEEDFISYQSRQIQKLAQQLDASSLKMKNGFSSQRAYQNLEKLNGSLKSYAGKAGRGNAKLQELIQDNGRQIESYQRAWEKSASSKDSLEVDNRKQFNDLVQSQQVEISRNQINRVDSNFAQGVQVYEVQVPTENGQAGTQNYTVPIPKREGRGSFDGKWFESNKFQTVDQEYSFKRDKPRQLRIASEPNEPQASSPARLNFRNSIANNEFGLLNDQSSAGEARQQVAAKPNDRPTLANLGNQSSPNSPFANPGLVDQQVSDQIGGIEIRPNSQIAASTSDGDVSQDFIAGMGMSDVQLPEPQLDPSDSGGGRSFGGENSPGSGVTGLSTPAQKSRAKVALASLDIELPESGIDFYFRSPRGNVSVSAMPVKADLYRNGISLGVILLIGCLGIVVSRLAKPTANIGLGLLLLLAGLCTLVSGALPIFGLLSCLIGIGLFFKHPE